MPNISSVEYSRLKQSDALLKNAQQKAILEPFIAGMLKSLGVILAMKPFVEWPEEAKIAFKNSQRQAPTSAELYLNLLPK